VVQRFFKKIIFPRFRVLKAVISDVGTHFVNHQLDNMLKKYGVTHKLVTPYHPQMSDQVEVSIRQINKILRKTVSISRKDWSLRLDDALSTYQTTYKTLIGMTPYKLVYEKAYHLPVEIEHKTYWSIKVINLDTKASREKRILDLHELKELRLDAYENA
jgi:hypothetical protein